MAPRINFIVVHNRRFFYEVFSVWYFDQACQILEVTKHHATQIRVGLIQAQNLLCRFDLPNQPLYISMQSGLFLFYYL